MHKNAPIVNWPAPRKTIPVDSLIKGGKYMTRKGFIPTQIINKLRETEIFLNQGETVDVISKKIGVNAHIYYRWRKEYAGIRVGQARRLKELEQENSRLKKLVADMSLDNAIPKEALRGTSSPVTFIYSSLNAL
jgi:putative transposase